jgi:hypothetical protein
MTRFSWAAWGLLVVVVDLPLRGWDVIPDLVGYGWLVVALSGADTVSRAFVRARLAALTGIPVAVITGTPAFADVLPVVWPGVVAEVFVVSSLVALLASGIAEAAPAGERRMRAWAGRVRSGALVAGALGLVGLVAFAGGIAVVYVAALLGLVIVGVLCAGLAARAARAGWLAGPAAGHQPRLSSR